MVGVDEGHMKSRTRVVRMEVRDIGWSHNDDGIAQAVRSRRHNFWKW